MNPVIPPEPAHLVTDASGHIDRLSRGARELLRGRGLQRGRSLLACFPEYRKALLFDMQLANAGWPTQRTLGPAWIGMAVRYRVHRLVSGDGLFWEFRVAGAAQHPP